MRPLIIMLILLLGFATRLRADDTAIAQQIEHFDELTFENPGAVVREGTALYEREKANLKPEHIVGLSVVIAESAGLYGKSETVWEWVQRGQALIETVNRPIERIRLFSLAGVALEFQGKSKEARASHNKAIEAAIAAKNLQMEANARELFTYFANREVDYLAVAQNVKRLQEIYQLLPKTMAYYNTRAAVGLFFASPFYKRYDEGIALIKESIAYFEDQHKTFLAFNYSNSLAGVLSTYKSEEAIRFGLELIKKYPETPDMPYPKYVYDSLGESYFRQQNYREALHYFRLSAEFWLGNGDNKLYYAELMLSVCRAYIRLKEYDKAWETFEKIKNFPEGASLNNQETWLELQVELWHHRANPIEELKALRKLRDVSTRYQEEQNVEASQKAAAQFDLQRIEEQKRQLEATNAVKTIELERVARTQRLLILLSVLILSMLLLALLYIRKRHEVMEKQQALQEILNTINEGIVRIGPGRRILPYYSRATSAFLGLKEELVGREILPILLQNSNFTRDQIQVAEETLNTILGENELNWDLNSAHLPEQVNIGRKVLSLAWQPTIQKKRVVDVVLTIIDISRHFELEEAVRQERARQTEFHGVINELRSVSMRRALRLLDVMQSRLSDPHVLKDRVWWHTQKGIARSLGLQRLSDEIHQLETSMVERKNLDAPFQQIQKTLEAYNEVASEIGSNLTAESGQDLLGLCSEILGGLKSTIEQHRLSFERILVDDSYHLWSETRLETLRDMLVHAMTNAIDHGFVRSKHRPIRITVRTEKRGNDFHLYLSDNGSGLNWEHMEGMARARGLKTFDRALLSELLFESGTSTTQAVSKLSGRGLGLAAIRERCQRLRGQCTIGDNPEGQGTELHLTWPESAWEGRLTKVS